MQANLCGTSIFYEQTGEATEGQLPIVFLHGWGCNHTFFDGIIQELKQLCVSVDFPGHGNSPEPPEPWGVPEYAGQILALMDQLGYSRVNLVAHSFGGRVAIWIASHAPERVGRMVLTGAAGLKKPMDPGQKKQLDRYHAEQNLLNRFKKIPLFSGEIESLQKKLRDKHSSPDYLALSEPMKETFKKVIALDLEEYLPQIQASTVLVWGENDTETPLWMGKEMESRIPDAALIVFTGKSHFAYLEDPRQFLLILQSFLTKEGVK